MAPVPGIDRRRRPDARADAAAWPMDQVPAPRALDPMPASRPLDAMPAAWPLDPEPAGRGRRPDDGGVAPALIRHEPWLTATRCSSLVHGSRRVSVPMSGGRVSALCTVPGTRCSGRATTAVPDTRLRCQTRARPGRYASTCPRESAGHAGRCPPAGAQTRAGPVPGTRPCRIQRPVPGTHPCRIQRGARRATPQCPSYGTDTRRHTRQRHQDRGGRCQAPPRFERPSARDPKTRT